MGNQIVMEEEQLFHVAPVRAEHPDDLLHRILIGGDVGLGVGIIVIGTDIGNIGVVVVAIAIAS